MIQPNFEHRTLPERVVSSGELHDCERCHDRPGSDSAILDGCVCPVMDNGHGHASRLVVVVGCPVHDSFLKESS